MDALDVVVIGGGQAALAAGYYLRRSTKTLRILDAEAGPGGAWRHTWPSLRLFSPARWSSLPGWLMPPTQDRYPTRDEALAYLADYERRLSLPVERPVRVTQVWADGARLRLVTSDGRELSAGAVVSATGTWTSPQLPQFPGQASFSGQILHSAQYAGPAAFAGRRVLVIGAGNSGAQIFADLVDHADATWVTHAPPVFLPDDVDGQVLFEQATERYKAIKEGRTPPPPRSLGDIVMVESVRALRDRGLLAAEPIFARFTPTGVEWPGGRRRDIDAVVFATGFRPALTHLAPLVTVDERGRLPMNGVRAAAHPQLFPLGYGDWTGFASATLVGVGRSAKAVADAITGSTA
ncbi:MAG: pyridine nucleotide-disulfide oxidoreductase [Gemmatimonas sp.]|nr:pyridine nucleotide-disulfide oxidoreductase [Gemmatimonas sp.]